MSDSIPIGYYPTADDCPSMPHVHVGVYPPRKHPALPRLVTRVSLVVHRPDHAAVGLPPAPEEMAQVIVLYDLETGGARLAPVRYENGLWIPNGEVEIPAPAMVQTTDGWIIEDPLPPPAVLEG